MAIAARRTFLLDVADIEDRLRRDQVERFHAFGVALRSVEPSHRLPFLHRGLDALDQVELGLRLLVTAARPLDQPLAPLFQRGEVGEQKLGVDQLGVAHRIDPALDMGDVVVLEAAKNVQDGIDAANSAQELVAQPLALGRATHQPRDVDHLELGLDDFLRLRDLGDHVQPWVGHRHPAGIGFDGAKGIIGCGRRCGRGQRVEEGRFADIGQPDDTAN